jgi:hypothetical protein
MPNQVKAKFIDPDMATDAETAAAVAAEAALRVAADATINAAITAAANTANANAYYYAVAL